MTKIYRFSILSLKFHYHFEMDYNSADASKAVIDLVWSEINDNGKTSFQARASLASTLRQAFSRVLDVIEDPSLNTRDALQKAIEVITTEALKTDVALRAGIATLEKHLPTTEVEG